jgi:NADH:ubiquinone oxidoreductase subunit B-like Fe-S oxidoreductase
MKIIFLLLFSFFVTSCIETPETPSSKEVLAQEKIQNNKTEAQKAQEEYIKLQKQRNNE